MLAGNLILNGGFETPIIVPHFQTFNVGDTSLALWDITAGSVDIVRSTTWPPFEGNNSLDLSGFNHGTLEQSFATSPGSSYTLSFHYGNHPGVISSSAQVSVLGASTLLSQSVIHSGSTSVIMNWTPFEANFVADSTVTTLVFVGTGPTNQQDTGTALDAISVAEVLPAIRSLGGPDVSNPGELVTVDGTLYFTAYNEASGRELWKSDGTEAGTVLVKDVFPGANYSDVSNLTSVGGTLYFTANDGVVGTELWKSNGTEAGTVLVKDIRAGAVGSGLGALTNVGGTLFFNARDGVTGAELWKSDGTEAGTVLVKDILAGEESSDPSPLTNIGGTLYFTAQDEVAGFELWKSDGTEGGTVLVRDIFAGAGYSQPTDLTNVGGTLYFVADDGVAGRELWKSNGTEAGTVLVKEILAGTNFSGPTNLTDVGGTLYFTAADGVVGTELWKSDGTEAGTVMVKDIRTGGVSSVPNHLTNVAGTLFFWANDGNGPEVWKSNGTEVGTVMVKDVNPSSSSQLFDITNANGTAYFEANDGTHGVELWRSDGTPSGTFRLKDINPGQLDSHAHDITHVGDKLFFSADNGVNRGLWVIELDRLPSRGDYDGDDDADGNDFLVWQRQLGAAPAGSGADGDASGTVDGGDLDVWREHFGESLEVSVAAVGTNHPSLALPIEGRGSENSGSGAYASGLDAGSRGSESRGHIESAVDALFAAGDFTSLFNVEDDVWGKWRRRK